MAHIGPLWQQAGSFSATADRQLLSALWPSGGASGGAVTAVSNTMNVSVAPGSAAVPMQSGQGSALCRWDAAENVALTASPPSGQSRIDLIVCQVRDHDVDAGSNNDFVLTVVAGTPAASSPAVPATPANAYALASVTVPGAAANLNGATITDLRKQSLAVPPPVAAPAVPPVFTQAGVLVQATGGAGNLDSIPFPVPFPNACLSWVGIMGYYYSGWVMSDPNQMTRTTFGLWVYDGTNKPIVGGTVRINWVAVGN